MELEESGEGQGGYAKEMSREFIDAEMVGRSKSATSSACDRPLRLSDRSWKPRRRAVSQFVDLFHQLRTILTDMQQQASQSLQAWFAETLRAVWRRIATPMLAQALFLEQCKDVDMIVTTAQIPGKQAPRLLTRYTGRS